jgi:hypothetical protein
MFNFFNKNKVHINGLTVTITKDYIDINDIDGILQTVQKVSSGYAMRRIIAYALVLSKCTISKILMMVVIQISIQFITSII